MTSTVQSPVVMGIGDTLGPLGWDTTESLARTQLQTKSGMSAPDAAAATSAAGGGGSGLSLHGREALGKAGEIREKIKPGGGEIPAPALGF
jgi:hypothetical protein